MKKVIVVLGVALFALPALAQAEVKRVPGPQEPALEMQDHEAFKKAREEHRAQIKATQEKMEKLVKEYNKLKDGKKKDAKRAEIEKEVSAIHEKQLAFKQEQLMKFEERLARMKEELANESSPEGKKAWVDSKTQALIQADGDMKELFGPRPGPRGRHFAPQGRDGGPHKGFGRPAPRD